MAKVYLETSFVSACVTNRRDPRSTYRRDISREWWETQRSLHELFISPEVLAELSDDAHRQSSEAVEFVKDVPILAINDEVVGVAAVLVRERVMPAPVAGDALHVATACVRRIEYMIKWNVRQLANRNKLVHLQTICLRSGYLPPQIVTPDLLWELSNEANST